MRTLGKTTTAALLLGVMALPATALAGTESGLYVGGSVGQASVGDIDIDGGEGFGNIDFDGDDTGYKLFVGYNFGVIPLIDLAIEGGYRDLGKPDGSIPGGNLEVDANGFDLFGLVGVNLGPVGVFAKVGAIMWDADVTFTGEGSASAGDDGTDPAYGIGARLKFGSLEVRAEYEMFDVDAVDDADFLSAGVAWTF